MDYSLMEYKPIKICIADHEKLGLERTWRDILQYLPPDDQEKALRYKQEPDRIRSVAGSCLILSHSRLAFPGDNIKIAKTEQGKPYAEGHTGFHFSLSHSGRLIVYAEDMSPVGVDVERVREKNWRIFHRYLTEKELKMIEVGSLTA